MIEGNAYTKLVASEIFTLSQLEDGATYTFQEILSIGCSPNCNLSYKFKFCGLIFIPVTIFYNFSISGILY